MRCAARGLRRRLWSLTLPVFFDIALLMLVGCVDTIMLSRCGDGAVAAVGMVNQLVSLVFLVYQFLSTGSAILCAQYYGADDKQRFAVTASLALKLNLWIGFAASAAISVWPGEILTLMGLRPELLESGTRYLRITGAFSIFSALSLALGAILRSAGRVVPPMVANVAGNVVNVIGNWMLIFGHFGFPAMGVDGAAYATSIARFAVFAVLGAYALHVWRLHRRSVPRPAPGMGRAAFCKLLKVSIPAMGEEISYCLSQVAAIWFINRISNEALAAKTYCSSLIMFVFLFCMAVTQGGDILVGHLVGRHRYRATYLMGTFFMRRAMMVTLVCSAALAVAGPFIMPFLTGSKEILRISAAILAIDVILEVGRVRNIFACGTLRAAGDVIYPVVVGISVQWTVGVGVAYLIGIPAGLGLVGVWIGFMLDENLRGIILMRRWHSLAWQGKAFV